MNQISRETLVGMRCYSIRHKGRLQVLKRSRSAASHDHLCQLMWRPMAKLLQRRKSTGQAAFRIVSRFLPQGGPQLPPRQLPPPPSLAPL
jgi:hypothetical protein